jgi:hypothetical protein
VRSRAPPAVSDADLWALQAETSRLLQIVANSLYSYPSLVATVAGTFPSTLRMSAERAYGTHK